MGKGPEINWGEELGDILDPLIEENSVGYSETVFPFKNGVRPMAQNERGVIASGKKAGYVSEEFPFIDGGKLVVELDPIDTSDMGFEYRIPFTDPSTGAVQFGSIYKLVPTISYDSEREADFERNVECIAMIDGKLIKSHNFTKDQNISDNVVAFFEEWRELGEKELFSFVVILDDSGDQRDNKVLANIGIRIERAL